MSYAPIPVADIHLSQTTAQVERRARFDKAALSELAESIKSLGLQQPIIARRVNGHFELVAGERRLLAAKQAGLETIDTIVREYTDEQVLEVQLIENLQREGLHELAEAEGYETLMKRHKLTVEDLVAKVGKSKGYVYARLKLTALCPEARRAFYDGKLNASTALLIARIPDHNLQRRALKEITAPQWGNGPLPYRQAAEHVHENYMLQLARAPFPTGDANLVPAAGPCGSCPKRTGNQKELFGDVKGADVCTDPVCFAAKRDANAARLAAAAKASGKEVIAGAAAKKIAPDGLGQYDRLKGHVRLDERFWSGNKQRTYRSAIGKDVEIKHLQDPETGQLVEIVSEADAKAALKKRGIKDEFAGGVDSGRYQAEQRARERKRRVELRFRRVLLETLRPKLATRVGRHELELIAAAFWRRRENETQKQILKLWELEPAKRQYGVDVEKPMLERIPKLTDAELALFLQDLVLAEDLQVWSFNSEGPRQLLATAKRVKVNADKIRRQVQAEMAPKKKPKKSAKGK
jgi:ParB/RepB/Spo0J family partition protein